MGRKSNCKYGESLSNQIPPILVSHVNCQRQSLSLVRLVHGKWTGLWEIGLDKVEQQRGTVKVFPMTVAESLRGNIIIGNLARLMRG